MKRLCALLLCAVLAMPWAAAASPSAWPQWAESALSWGQKASISAEFLAAPESAVNRGMVAQLLYEAAGRPPVSGPCPFADVSGPYAASITWEAEQGYLTGTGDGLYTPSRPVTRQEFATILWRQAGSPTMQVQGLSPFQDVDLIAAWARLPILWCLRTGVMGGRSVDRLAPTGTVTVAEEADTPTPDPKPDPDDTTKPSDTKVDVSKWVITATSEFGYTGELAATSEAGVFEMSANKGEVWTLAIKGVSGTVKWAVESNSSSLITLEGNKLTISGSSGSATITGTVNGGTVKAIIRPR